jgi:hypothetical protein
MFEFIATATGSLFLRIEHDSDCFSRRSMRKIENSILATLECLGKVVSYERIRDQIRSLELYIKKILATRPWPFAVLKHICRSASDIQVRGRKDGLVKAIEEQKDHGTGRI